jgi:hypothetical protein
MMMEEVGYSETSVSMYQTTRRRIPEETTYMSRPTSHLLNCTWACYDLSGFFLALNDWIKYVRILFLHVSLSSCFTDKYRPLYFDQVEVNDVECSLPPAIFSGHHFRNTERTMLDASPVANTLHLRLKTFKPARHHTSSNSLKIYDDVSFVIRIL